MGRPKKEKYEIEERFLTEALLLAGSYSDAIKEKKQLQDLMTGEFEYTEDMAIQDLIGGGQQEGEGSLMGNSNEMTIIFDSRPENEGLARVAAAAFCTQLNPTLEEVADLKTAVSEAVTNCIIHGYQGEVHKIRMKCVRKERTIYLDIEDDGIGIADVEKAMEPLYTTRADQDRSGMGFTFMEAFMDEVKVTSQVGKGTCVHMSKKIGN